MAAVEPQGGAYAAERVRAFLDAWRQLPDYDNHESLYVTSEGRSRVADPTNPPRWLALFKGDLIALLADRARMAAELEQVRGERDALQRLYDGREDDEPHTCDGAGIMTCSICGEGPVR